MKKLLTTALLGVSLAVANDVSVYSINSGTVSVEVNDFVSYGSIGQPFLVDVNNDDFTLQSGFWSIVVFLENQKQLSPILSEKIASVDILNDYVIFNGQEDLKDVVVDVFDANGTLVHPNLDRQFNSDANELRVSIQQLKKESAVYYMRARIGNQVIQSAKIFRRAQ